MLSLNKLLRCYYYIVAHKLVWFNGIKDATNKPLRYSLASKHSSQVIIFNLLETNYVVELTFSRYLGNNSNSPPKTYYCHSLIRLNI